MKLLITSIEKGIVIDHIPSEQTLAVINVLKLEDASSPVIIATNLASKTLKKKGMVKIAHRLLSQEEISSIALLTNGATLNIIEHHKVVKKIHITLPDMVEKIAQCPNKRCISNSEAHSKFIKTGEDIMQCYYCENIFPSKSIVPTITRQY